MAQTVANLTEVLKEAWTSNRLEKQFYDDHPWLTKMETVEATMIGEKAIVPIHKGRSGGYTSTNSAGGSLNPADEQKVDTAEYTLVYHWFQTAIETGAIAQAAGGDSSVVVAKSLELEGALNDTRAQCMRQLATFGDGVVAACDTGGASTTIELLPTNTTNTTAYGFHAIEAGWLQPGTLIDVGTLADTDVLATGVEITAVKESDTDPDITTGTSVSTTSGTHFVFMANPNSATAAPPELNGLGSMIGSTTSALGGLDPDTAGEEFWKPAKVDSTTTTGSLALFTSLQRKVFQKTHKSHGQLVLTSPTQQENMYLLLQNQVRYTGELKLGAGDVGGIIWNGQKIDALPDILDQHWFCLTPEHFVRIVPKGITKPTWMSELQGSNKGMQWVADATNFKDAVVYPFQVGLKRRNSHAAATALVA